MQVLKQEPLKKLTSFHIGGPADIHIPENVQEFVELVLEYPEAFILGSGTKMLFPDEPLRIPVILTTELTNISETEEGIRVDCGYPLAKLFDFAMGVPATVGGALWFNFGAFDNEVANFINKVRIVSGKEDRWLKRDELSFAYRDSSIQQNGYAVAEVIFNRKQLENKEAFLQKRLGKQPIKLYSAGSIFKNPPGLYAGKLIESCGLKGTTVGDAMVWEKHANFIVNKGKATSRNVQDLIQKMHEKVLADFNVDLEVELSIYEQ